MKIALFSLFSLLCVQVVLSASLPQERPNGETELLNQSRKDSGVSVFTHENEVSPNLNILACVRAFKELGEILAILRGRGRGGGQFTQKSVESNQRCKKVGGDPKYFEECLKMVEDEQEEVEQDAINGELQSKLVDFILSLGECVL